MRFLRKTNNSEKNNQKVSWGKISADLHVGPATLDNLKINGFIFLQTALYITLNMVGIEFTGGLSVLMFSWPSGQQVLSLLQKQIMAACNTLFQQEGSAGYIFKSAPRIIRWACRPHLTKTVLHFSIYFDFVSTLWSLFGFEKENNPTNILWIFIRSPGDV